MFGKHWLPPLVTTKFLRLVVSRSSSASFYVKDVKKETIEAVAKETGLSDIQAYLNTCSWMFPPRKYWRDSQTCSSMGRKDSVPLHNLQCGIWTNEISWHALLLNWFACRPTSKMASALAGPSGVGQQRRLMLSSLSIPKPCTIVQCFCGIVWDNMPFWRSMKSQDCNLEGLRSWKAWHWCNMMEHISQFVLEHTNQIKQSWFIWRKSNEGLTWIHLLNCLWKQV